MSEVSLDWITDELLADAKKQCDELKTLTDMFIDHLERTWVNKEKNT